MRLLLLVLLFLLVGCLKSNKQEKTDSDKNQIKTEIIDKIAIPEKVKEFLTITFPRWTLPDTSEYIKSWWSFYSTYTYYIANNFNYKFKNKEIHYGLSM